MTATNTETRRLVIVSNRLPFNVVKEDGELRFNPSVGGLVTGLEAYLASMAARRSLPNTYLWVGWPGASVGEDMRKRLKAEALDRFRSHPVFFAEEEMDRFYHGFCNKTIWPLFHYFPSYARYQEDFWQSYKRVNEIFCDALLEVLQPDDMVWIHDYHLMLLPRLLRNKGPSIPIGYFLHIPFPDYEIFRLLPALWRREILDGILGADLIGFHTFEYSQSFLQCVLRILDHEHNLGQISLPSHMAKVNTCPMGIDFEKFRQAANAPETLKEKEELARSLPQSKIVLSVDRLDYSKGILNRLEGFEILLDRYPEFRGKVVMVMVVVPSRVAVDRYESMKKQIEETVGRVNGRFGAVGWTPIVYQFRFVPFHPLVALYTASDVALITPLRDGMNLVAKEYIASRADGTGVLILSEMAGAAKELGEAVIVNPNNREEIADALREALEMPVEEQKRRNSIMQARLKSYDVLRWADEFVRELAATREVQERFLAKLLPASAKQEIRDRYRQGRKRLVLLDYDGTLVPFERRPYLARPSESVLRLLRLLSDDPCNTAVLISGRDKETLQRWFGDVVPNIVAEHGVWIREDRNEWKLSKQQGGEWKPRILPILHTYADRLPGSFVEEKEYSVAWHYRTADPEQSKVVLGDVTNYLMQFTATIGLQVLRGNKVVEVRTAGVTKGAAAQHWLAKDGYDFVLAIGDDLTDEDLFAVLADTAWSIRVGIANTRARYNLRDSREVLRLLESVVVTA